MTLPDFTPAAAAQDSLLGHDISTGEQVYLPITRRRLGTYVLGGNGRGKSQLLEHLIMADIEAGRGVCVLDPHRDLTERILERIPSQRRHEVILLDAADQEEPFGLNLLEVADPSDEDEVYGAVQSAMHIFERLYGVDRSDTARLARFLRNAFYTLASNPGMTLLELPRLFSTLPEDVSFRKRLLANVHNRQVRRFWAQYDGLRDAVRDERNESTYNRIEELLLNPTVRYIVGQSESAVDFGSAMEMNRIILVQLISDRDDVTMLVGGMVVARLLAATLVRYQQAEHQRQLFMVYADEFQTFANRDFAKFFSEARKYQVALTVAHQYRDQLGMDEQNKGATLQVGSTILFAVSGPDAEVMAGQLDATPTLRPSDRTQPLMALPVNPIEHLQRTPHTNPRVHELSRTLLRRLTEDIELTREQWERMERGSSIDERVTFRMFGGLFELHRRALESAIEELNEVLLQAMETKRAESYQYAKVVYLATGVVFIPNLNDSLWRSYCASTSPVREALVEYGLGMIREDEAVQRAGPDYLGVAEARFRDLLPAAREIAGQIRELIILVGKEPITVPTGQVEPVMERRTVADMRNELANTLVSLPDFTAYVKAGTAEHTIHTLPPADRSTFPSRGWTPYPMGRSRQEVIEEMDQRNEDEPPAEGTAPTVPHPPPRPVNPNRQL